MFVQPLLQWKSNEYYTTCVCICNLRYPACNAHWPYYHLWPVLLYNIFPHYLIKSRIFENMLLNIKCVFRVYLQLLYQIFFILRRNERDILYDRKCILVFMWSTCYSCPIVMKLEFSRQSFEKYSNTKFHETPSSGSRVVPCRRTDRQDELIVAFHSLRTRIKTHKKYKKLYSHLY
jgi:hypothetical protein